MSLEVAKVVAHVQEKTNGQYTNPEIATALALICGAICLGIGVLRVGFVLEFIPGKHLLRGLKYCTSTDFFFKPPPSPAS